MNRKTFLQYASAGVAAASFLPLLSFTKNLKSSDYFMGDKFLVIKGQEWLFSFTIDSDLLSKFTETSDQTKEIKLSGNTETDLVYKADSIIEKTIDSKNLHFITFSIIKDKLTSENFKFAKDAFGKEFIMEVHDKCHAVIRNEKLKVDLPFRYIKNMSSDPDANCFLTSACVSHKGLPDDCAELMILRNLRETVMKPNPIFNQLIAEYNVIAPKMLSNIGDSENKGEILETIYSNLVLPAVNLVEEGKNEEAIAYYRDFVQEMKYLYL